jgi:hypothetical protein
MTRLDDMQQCIRFYVAKAFERFDEQSTSGIPLDTSLRPLALLARDLRLVQGFAEVVGLHITYEDAVVAERAKEMKT